MNAEDDALKEAVFALYLKRGRIRQQLGPGRFFPPTRSWARHLESGEKRLLFDWILDESLWKRRIAVIATYWYIKRGRFDELLKMAEQLLGDDQDLIHKAVGWMLREVGKKELAVEEAFLRRHYRNMPRTMLRYAIERFDEKTRKDYLEGRIECSVEKTAYERVSPPRAGWADAAKKIRERGEDRLLGDIESINPLDNE